MDNLLAVRASLPTASSPLVDNLWTTSAQLPKAAVRGVWTSCGENSRRDARRVAARTGRRRVARPRDRACSPGLSTAVRAGRGSPNGGVWPDGSVHWVEERGRGIYTADGTRVRLIGTSLDITERIRAEEALRTSEERFRKQYKGMPVPTYSFGQAGDDFVLQDYNDAADSVAEGRMGDWLGKGAAELYPDQPDILADLRTCVAEQRTLRREAPDQSGTIGRVRQLALSGKVCVAHLVGRQRQLVRTGRGCRRVVGQNAAAGRR